MCADPLQEPSASKGVLPVGDATLVSPPLPVQVRTAAEADRPAWNAFVYAEPEATFFHRFEWRDVLGRAFGHRSHYLLAERAGRVVGVLPLAEVKSALFGHSLISTPFCVYGGIVARDAGAFEALEQAACELARRLGVDYLEMRNRAKRHVGWPSKDLYVAFRKPIDEDPEKNLLAIPRKQRAVVRKGIKEGCVAELDAGVERHYTMYSESLRNLGTPVFSRRYLEILREVFGADCDVLTVTHQGTPVASCLNFYFRDEVLPYYGGGTTPRGRSAATTSCTGRSWSAPASAAAGCSTTAAASSARGPTTSSASGASSRRRCTTSTSWSAARRCRTSARPTRSTAGPSTCGGACRSASRSS
jgi:FemAB-related protein (PEP-CTERM system-associated)